MSLLDAAPEGQCHFVKHICSDRPWVLLSRFQELVEHFPTLEVISEDPVQGKIRVQQAGEQSICGALILRVNTAVFLELGDLGVTAMQ